MVAGMDELLHRLTWRGVGAAVAALTFAAACAELPARDVEQRKQSKAEGGSSVPLDSALALFRAEIAPVTTLSGAEPSIGAVVSSLERSLRDADTARIRSLVMSRQEFAWLYYPTSRYTQAPTRQEPALAWFLHVQQSQKGATRLLTRFGGRPLRILSNSCAEPRLEGRNQVWHDCMQRFIAGADTLQIRLFGGIYEHNGRYKIFSYSNDL
jgi:hypothetical protein